MQPENKKQEEMCIVAICEVCYEPLIFEREDAMFVIENDHVQCEYCRQMNPLSDELKTTMIDIY